MPQPTFLGYVGDADFHDGCIVSTERQDSTIYVHVRGASGANFVVVFGDVVVVRANHPEGMMLYALSEMSCEPPLRRFVFSNWDIESDAHLEIEAVGLNVIAEK